MKQVNVFHSYVITSMTLLRYILIRTPYEVSIGYYAVRFHHRTNNENEKKNTSNVGTTAVDGG